VRADEKLTASVELESVICACTNCVDRAARFFPSSTPLNGSESGGEHLPRQVVRLFQTRNFKNATQRGRKEET
jgi:hypothetical protein